MGLAGLLLPMIPGVPLEFLGLLRGAWAEDYVHRTAWCGPAPVVWELLIIGITEGVFQIVGRDLWF